jgi:uncharacterized protein (TIGR00290 family)
MPGCKKAVLLWSGGKDSALALHQLAQSHAALQVVKLVTCVSQAFDRVSMHGVRRQLVEEQADALGLPIHFVVIPNHEDAPCPLSCTTPGTTFPPNDVYTRAMLEAFAQLRAEGVDSVVFGDIFLQDLRAFREGLLGQSGLQGCYPLWGRDSTALFDEFHTSGFQAITVCVDAQRLTEKHCGQLLTPAFRASLPDGVDPCGERGEYHSFAFDGPIFHEPVPYRLGEIHLHEPFAFQELFPSLVQQPEPAFANL